MLQGLFSVTAAFRYFISKCPGGVGGGVDFPPSFQRNSQMFDPDLQRLQPSVSTHSEIAAETERGPIFISAKRRSNSFLAVRSSLWKLETTVKTALVQTAEKKKNLGERQAFHQRTLGFTQQMT